MNRFVFGVFPCAIPQVPARRVAAGTGSKLSLSVPLGASIPRVSQPPPKGPRLQTTNRLRAESEWRTGTIPLLESGALAAAAASKTGVRIADIAEADGTEACLFYYLIQAGGCGCLYSLGFRKKLRLRYGLPAAPCGDIWMHWCCRYCSVCQEYRELKNRGWDPSIGFSANKTRSPPPQQFMQS
ncbi:unnamed protein product [Closterium sp. Naga37s-1]|nr:unnamed protein product [Closterium sp. Naga37s-1]